MPAWFTIVLHWWRRRACRERGHLSVPVPGGVCAHCGHEWTAEQISRAEDMMLTRRLSPQEAMQYRWPADESS